jgi:hypothetical protein
VVVRISYADDYGHRYSDLFPLDVDLLRNRTYVESSTSPDAQRKELVKAVKGIKEIRAKRTTPPSKVDTRRAPP